MVIKAIFSSKALFLFLLKTIGKCSKPELIGGSRRQKEKKSIEKAILY